MSHPLDKGHLTGLFFLIEMSHLEKRDIWTIFIDSNPALSTLVFQMSEKG